jgi:alpha-glucosidase
MLAAGIQGCPFVCPDMIGGGCGGEGFATGRGLDRRLFVRSCQVQALMPMMQFSAAPWRLLGEEELNACREAANLHVAIAPRILTLARHAAETCEPIVRHMEYVFPHQGFDECLQQFMLGDDLLVAPVVHPDDHVSVRIPAGKWRDDLGEEHVGPCELELHDVPLNRIPRYSRCID